MRADKESGSKPRETIVNVDGEQVFTANFIWEQMSAQSCRIDRARVVALTAVVVGILAIIISIVALARL